MYSVSEAYIEQMMKRGTRRRLSGTIGSVSFSGDDVVANSFSITARATEESDTKIGGVVAAVALIIATNPNAGSIMGLVSTAWGVFGAAFGPAILLSLFWKRFNMAGCVAGIVVGAVVDCLYLAFCSKTGIYELVPGFFVGLIAAIAIALATPAPSEELNKLFDDAVKYND